MAGVGKGVVGPYAWAPCGKDVSVGGLTPSLLQCDRTGGDRDPI